MKDWKRYNRGCLSNRDLNRTVKAVQIDSLGVCSNCRQALTVPSNMWNICWEQASGRTDHVTCDIYSEEEAIEVYEYFFAATWPGKKANSGFGSWVTLNG